MSSEGGGPVIDRELPGDREPRYVVPHIDPPTHAGIGIIAPFDFAIDREIWSIVPDHVVLHVTRTPYVGLAVSVALAEEVADTDNVADSSRDLSVVRPAATVYLCTSGSFVHGLAGEERLRIAMEEHGAVRAITTSGALLEALEALGVQRVGVGTPYVRDLTLRLDAFLVEAGLEPVQTAYLGLTGNIPLTNPDTVRELARAAATDDAEAVFLSCTNLPTFDVLVELERELGRPVLSSNLVSMWSALRSLQALDPGRPEQLFQRTAEDA